MTTTDDVMDVERKIQYLQGLLENARQRNDIVVVRANQKRLGQLYLETGNAPEALTHFEEAIKTLEPDDHQSLAQFYGYAGLALKLIGNYTLALRAFRKSNTAAVASEKCELICDSHIQLGIVQSEMDHKTEAVSELGRALSLAIESQDLPRKLRILDLLGDNFYALESFDKAVEDYVIAYETAKILGNRPAECTSLIKVANVFLFEREFVAAIGQYERALEIASSLENRNAEISILGGLCRANALSGNIPLAIKYGDQVVHLAREFKHFDAEITNIYALASFLIDQDRAEEALLYLDRGRLLARENQSHHWLQAVITLIGTVHYNAGEYEFAIENYKEALALAMSEADVENEARLCGYLGAVLAERDLYAESIEYATRADNLANELENYLLAGEQQMLLAFNYRDTNQPEKAMEYCKAAINSYEMINNTQFAEQAGLLLSELQG